MRVLFACLLLISLTLTHSYAQVKLTSQTIDLTDKTFIIDEEGEISKTGDDLHLFLLFHKNGNATFRPKRGSMITKDSPLSWRLVGDSLYLQQAPISLVADGKTQSITREPMKYAIIKTSRGYLLKEKDSQMLLFEIK
ncbi:hypothetical protein [Spirosoma endophyticum]|uniref:NlpE N-terminal domain-containing protein n=1 Tax=Spirosoma endophyticum TaxID=662367 RepID=A0A1I2HYJ5_9BACT|nr:hypothetical protein [Spirosoma endophyticum]SFF34518.1 hypothetical protein SAMN05216167_1516 [Spirosoma endophyticum]